LQHSWIIGLRAVRIRQITQLHHANGDHTQQGRQTLQILSVVQLRMLQPAPLLQDAMPFLNQ